MTLQPGPLRKLAGCLRVNAGQGRCDTQGGRPYAPRRIRPLVTGAHARDIGHQEAGGGRSPRQPGQVGNEAALTSFAPGHCPVSAFPLFNAVSRATEADGAKF